MENNNYNQNQIIKKIVTCNVILQIINIVNLIYKNILMNAISGNGTMSGNSIMDTIFVLHTNIIQIILPTLICFIINKKICNDINIEKKSKTKIILYTLIANVLIYVIGLIVSIMILKIEVAVISFEFMINIALMIAVQSEILFSNKNIKI